VRELIGSGELQEFSRHPEKDQGAAPAAAFPAEAGIHVSGDAIADRWTPAFAGVANKSKTTLDVDWLVDYAGDLHGATSTG
jgi:hypothetical protein